MDKVKLLEAFRDFFYYGRKESMRKAYLEIFSAVTPGSRIEKIDWEQEEFIFNRLFIGPMTPQAPAVASVYLDPEGLVQGPVTARIRDFYKSIGLGLEEVGREPEDSIAYELDAARHLLLLGRDIPEAIEIYTDFICQHFALWIPDFTTRALESCADSVAVRNVLELLSGWVEKETGNITQQKEIA